MKQFKNLRESLNDIVLDLYETSEDFDIEELNEAKDDKTQKSITFQSVIIQILIIDTIFSIDSIITAVGMVDHLIIMILAILISSALMVALALPIGNFIDKHPSIKILALSFLIMIGTMLVADAFGKHIPKGYIYFALVYALAIEFINLKLKKKKIAD